MISKVLFVLFLTGNVDSISQYKTSPWVSSGTISGKTVENEQFPFMVAILRNGKLSCLGALIANQWVLTSAQCLMESCNNSTIINTSIPDSIHCSSPPETTVLLGTHNLNSGGTTYKTKKLIFHKNFTVKAFNSDIGLIQIDGTLKNSDTIKPIDFGEVGSDVNCITLGWGSDHELKEAEILQYVDLQTIDLDACVSLSEKYLKYDLGPEKICVVTTVGYGVCYGDSGGPLVCDGKLAGITSYSIGTCAFEYPSVFTRVASYLDWINRNTK